MAKTGSGVDITKVANIDESNYLHIEYRNLLNKLAENDYSSLADQLWYTGETFELLELDGLLDKAGGVQAYYLEAMRWLGGFAATTNWVAIPALTANLDAVTKKGYIDQFFQSWFPNYISTFFGQPILSGFFGTVVHPGPTTQTKRQLELVTQHARELEANLINVATTQKKEITQAAGLKEWQEYFDKLISPNMKLVSKNKLKLHDDNKDNYYSLAEHYGLWKNIWLFVFAIALISTTVLNFIYFNKDFIEILPIKIAIIVLFGYLFTSANKNYRIYSNLLDQMRFRSLVAKTIQSIIVDDTRIQPDEKRLLLTVAANALFEMKTNGHLTKKESASPSSELLTALISRGGV